MTERKPKSVSPGECAVCEKPIRAGIHYAISMDSDDVAHVKCARKWNHGRKESFFVASVPYGPSYFASHRGPLPRGTRAALNEVNKTNGTGNPEKPRPELVVCGEPSPEGTLNCQLTDRFHAGKHAAIVNYRMVREWV